MSHLNTEIEKQVLKLEDLKKQLEAKSNNIYVTMGQNFGKVAAKDFDSLARQLQQVQIQITCWYNIKVQTTKIHLKRN